MTHGETWTVPAGSQRRRERAVGALARIQGECGSRHVGPVATLRPVRLGRSGPAVSAMGLGCMGMSGVYGTADDQESVATIHAALDAGITVLDTGDFCGSGHNEMLIGRAIAGLSREQVQLSVKFGGLRGPDGRWGGVDTRPVAVRNFLAYSLRRLGTDYIDIYRPARLDPAVPIEETVGAIAEAVRAGWVRHVGLSEVGADTLRRASAVHPICDVQLECSVLSRGIESAVLPAARELGIAITAYGVLSRGLVTEAREATFAPGDFRAQAPRFQPANLTHNWALVDRLRPVADRHGLSVAQVAIAWVAAQGDDIVPIVGTKRRDRLSEALAAVAVELTSADLAEIDAAVPPGSAVGERYAPLQMSHLDRER